MEWDEASGRNELRLTDGRTMTNAPSLVEVSPPSEGDRVALLRYGGTWFVLGKLRDVFGEVAG